MKRRFGLRLRVVLLAATAGALFCGSFAPVFAQKKKSKEEIETQIRALEQNKQQAQTNRMKSADANRPTRADLETIIAQYERFLEGCAHKKSARCTDDVAVALYTLGSLYYDQAKENHAKHPGSAPPDYSKSLNMYWQLTIEYPNFPKLPEAFFQMSQNYLVAGHLDSTRIILEQLITRFPFSPRVSAAQFRLGELAFMEHNIDKACEDFKKVRKDQIDSVSWKVNLNYLSECAKR